MIQCRYLIKRHSWLLYVDSANIRDGSVYYYAAPKKMHAFIHPYHFFLISFFYFSSFIFSLSLTLSAALTPLSLSVIITLVSLIFFFYSFLLYFFYFRSSFPIPQFVAPLFDLSMIYLRIYMMIAPSYYL